MKKLFIFLVMIFTIITVEAQSITTIESTDVSFNYGNNWSSWEKLNPFVKIMFSNNYLIVFSEEPQHYEILTQAKDTVINNTHMLIIQAIDSEKRNCQIFFALRENKQLELHIDYQNFQICYLIKQSGTLIFNKE
jgi:hypothetical protein